MRNAARSIRTSNTVLTTSSILYRAACASVLVALSAGSANALPSGANVVSGNVNIQQPDGSNLVVNQGTDKAIINWNSFDILNGESTRFNQPNANSVALNRIGNGSATQILGKLSANGKLVVVNPNGVVFGAGSAVDVGGLIASTADISNANFLAGNMKFNRPGAADASIINKGRITAAEGGLVALVAPGVKNEGIIQAKMGTVQLASAETVTIDMYGDNLYSFKVGEKAKQAAKDENGNTMDSAVENSGTISAQGGTVLLTANAAKDIVTNAVNNTGVIEATAARIEGGAIVLDGGAGHVNVSGTLDASGKSAGQKGGKVTVTGKTIALAGATVDASGAAAGGTVKVGGDYQGQGTLARAKEVTMDAASSINVSATENGNGGLAVLWSDKETTFNGTITAKGGAQGGNGGLVETSSKGTLNFEGGVDASAAKDANGVALGAKGKWLLDPTDIVIGLLQAAGISLSLSGGTDVTLWTSETPGGTDAGNITLNAGILSLGDGDLTMIADHDIILNAAITLLVGGNVKLDAANNIQVGGNGQHGGNGGNGTTGTLFGVPFAIDGLNGTNGSNVDAAITTGTGSITLNAGNDIVLGGAAGNGGNGGNGGNAKGNGLIQFNGGKGGKGGKGGNGGNGSINSGTGAITLTAGHDVSIGRDGTVGSNGSNGTAGANSNSRVGGAGGIGGVGGVSGTGSITSLAGNVTINSTGDTKVNTASVTSGLGALKITAANLLAKASTFAGLNVNVKTTDKVTLTNGSKIDAVTGIIVDNAGAFTADANSLNSIGGVSVRQSTAGSIQNAIDAIGVSGIGGKVLLGSGVFDQRFQVVNKGIFSVSGKGATGPGATVIKPDASDMVGVVKLKNGPRSDEYAPIVLVKDNAAATISDLAIDGNNVGGGYNTAGLVYYNSNGLVQNVDINNGGAFGLWSVADSSLGQTNGLLLANNVSSRNNLWAAGAFIGDRANINIVGGTWDGTNGEEAIDMSVGSRGTITNATIKTGNHTGISFHGAHDVLISGGTITGSNASASGIEDDGLTYGMPATNKVTILGTNMNGVKSGVIANGGADWTILGGTYNGTGGGHGVQFKNLTQSGALPNSVTGVTMNNFANGVAVQGTTGAALTGNIISNVVNGFELSNANGTMLTGNTVTGAYKGIYAELSSGLNILGNTFKAMSGFGMDLLYAGGHNILGNTATSVNGAYGYGIRLINGDGSTLTGNTFNGFDYVGILASSSNGLQMAGNTVNGGDYGVVLANSDGATMTLNTIDSTRKAALSSNDSSGHDIFVNFLTNVKGDGIVLTGVSDSKFTTNFVTKAAGFTGGTGIGSTYFDGANYVGNTYTGNVVTDFGTGIHINGVGNATLTLNVLNNNSTGIALTYGANNNTVDTNFINDSTNGIVAAYTSDNKLLRNVITGVKGDGISITGSKLAGYDTDATVYANLVTAAGGNTTGKGISVDDVDDVNIGDGTVPNANIVTGFGRGVSVTSSDRVNVNGNGLVGNSTGVYVNPSTNVSVIANLIVGGDIGVWMKDSVGNFITSNFITGTSSDGVFVDNSNKTTVNNNTILLAGNDGVSVSGSNQVKITGNTIAATRDGVRLDTSNKAEIKSNTAIGGGRNGVSLVDSNKAEIDNNPIVGLGGDGIHAVRSNQLTVTANTIGGSDDGISLRDSNKATINGNTAIVGAGRDGIHAVSSNELGADGNILIAGVRDGVFLKDSNRATLNANIITGLGRDGVHAVDSNRLTVTGNAIGGKRDGVHLRGSNKASISTNVAILGGRDGVNLRNSHEANVNGNTLVTGLGRDGIHARNADQLTVSGNTALGGARDGVNARRSDDITVSGNTAIIGGRHGVFLRNFVGGDISGNSVLALTGNGVDVKNAGLFGINGNSSIISLLGDGVVVDNAGLFSIAGNGVAAGNNGISLTRTALALVAGNGILAGDEGIYLNNAQGTAILGNGIVALGNGIEVANNSAFTLIAGNGIAALNDGVNISDSNANVIAGNGIAAGRHGVNIKDSTGNLIALNGIAAGRNGVHLRDADLTAVVGNGIIAGRDGINGRDSDGVLIAANDIHSLTRDGIHLRDGIGNVILLNDIDAGRDGINGAGLNGNIIAGNTITTPGRDGVNLRDSSYTLLAYNTVDGAGRDGFRQNGGRDVLFFENTADNNANGYHVLNGADNVTFINNHATGNTNGAVVEGSSDIAFNGNSFTSNTGHGLLATSVSNLKLNGNSFTDNAVGAKLVNTNNATFTGDIFTGNTLGIALDNSDNTRLEEQTIDTAAGGTGIAITNGSNNTIVRGLNIRNGLYGIVLDGADSAMQFESNTSRFDASVGYYFALSNNAMQGQTLDASQQTFDNVRATDFTIQQWIDAEAKTIDMESKTPIGDVFYKSFPGFDEDQQNNRRGLYRRGLFSYAGRTQLAANVEEKPVNFNSTTLNLSLLNSNFTQASNPTSAPNIASMFANLAPAAGGKVDPKALASLSPSAGGNASQLASLAPAAGGADGGCGNSFLGGGFSTGFSCQ